MKKVISYLLDQKLLINLVVVIIVLAGIFSFSGINRESIPDIKFDMVTITTIYPGASPSDAEELISIPIEKKLRSISNLDKVRAYNVENVSLIVVFIEDKASDKKKIVQDIKDAVEQVGGLPANAQKPLVAEVTFDNTELVSVAFTGKDSNVPYSRLREFANSSENFFYDIDGIAEVEKLGYYDREYLVEVDPDALDKYRIGMNTLVNALKMRNIDFPGGALRIDLDRKGEESDEGGYLTYREKGPIYAIAAEIEPQEKKTCREEELRRRGVSEEEGSPPLVASRANHAELRRKQHEGQKTDELRNRGREVGYSALHYDGKCTFSPTPSQGAALPGRQASDAST